MTEDETDRLIVECERLKAELDRIPGWRVLKRYHATNRWLTAVGALQEHERRG